MKRCGDLSVVFVMVLFSGVGFARGPMIANPADHAAGSSDSGCVLATAQNGQVITIRGKAVQEPHDLAFDVPGCKQTVLLTYAGDQDNDVSANELRRDDQLKRFRKYTTSTYEGSKKNLCIQCMKYGDVEATLTGKLEIANIPPGMTKDPAGFLRNASGKIVGKWGWGHPVPFAGYRLVIESVSEVTDRKLPRPQGNKP